MGGSPLATEGVRGCAELKLRVRFKQRQLSFQLLRQADVIVVEHRDQRTCRRLNPNVSRRSGSCVGLADNPDREIMFGRIPLDNSETLVLRAVVDDQDLVSLPCLCRTPSSVLESKSAPL